MDDCSENLFIHTNEDVALIHVSASIGYFH